MKILKYILILTILLGIASPLYSLDASKAHPEEPCQYAKEDTKSSTPLNPPCGYYQLLAPIITGSDTDITNFNPADKNALGGYLNTMLRIFIGICAVLAMGMIVLGGLEYMTSELGSSKESGKKKITGALLGLVLALGSYALLNTINPDLLNTDINIEQQTIQVALSQAIQSDSGKTPPLGPLVGCTTGIQKTTIGMFACGKIVQAVNVMLAQAKSMGFNITGGGYRTVEEQKAMRVANCNGDITNANARCVPPTALPGQSNHNNGNAFDLECDGVLIQTQDNKCFIWLKTYASTFGLYNLASEPWHWSVDGR